MANVKEAKEFVKRWKTRGDEKQETQRFWIELLDKVLEDHDYDKHILFEVVADKVEGGSNFKDAVINRFTDHAVLIEQKSSSLRLDKSEPRFSRMVTPFEQAKHYDDLSAVGDKARWIITCNFREFWIYDMTKTGRDLYTPAAMIALEELPSKLHWLDTLITHPKEKIEFIDEVAVSAEAGRLVGVMYDVLRKRYADPNSPETAKSLNRLCVRLVFCLYAEDAGLFNKNNRKVFHDYLEQFSAKKMRKGLEDLFRVLNQKENERDKYLAEDDPLLASFPYVNGGLFSDDVEIPPFDDEIRDILLVKESMGFDWSAISPTIFGAVFESTLNPETRRAGGMHYTSIENIHKVIDPLFLDDLTAELDEILTGKQVNIKERKLLDFQKKLAGLKFLDPAAGSGNFLTESYLSLRRLENQCIKARLGYRVMSMDFDDNVKVSIGQFHGIEINDFAVAVAKTALWIAEAQMHEQTQKILSRDREFLPLHEYDGIKEGNALCMDWNDVVPASELTYIMGNPPFLGYGLQTTRQKKDILSLYVDEKGNAYKTAGKIDYVSGWYMKSCQYMQGTKIHAALVSTNSITQGEQVSSVWEPLFTRYHLHIDFAYRTFVWDSEATAKAHVHCVIIGFSCCEPKSIRVIYESGEKISANQINPYLIDAPIAWIHTRSNPICSVPKMTTGNRPADGGHLIIEANDYPEFIKKEPAAKKYIKPFVGSEDYINGKKRYCLWLVGVSPAEIKALPEVLKRIEACRNDRLNGAADRVKLAEKPMLFRETKNPENYIIVPRHSSEKRLYIPLGFLDENSIPADSAVIIPDAKEYEFGILTSSVHMSWMRLVAGRLEMRYRYSKDIVYNNFPWPEPTRKQKAKIEQTAQMILDARAKYPEASLADMYGEYMYLYPELLKAHQANDAAVMEAYDFKKGMTESEIVAELMKMYQKLTASK